MSLAVVWSYFHSIREQNSDMAKHFVIIAPNLTVFERLKEDFGDGKIFDTDPLIPTSWRGDWHMNVVLQDAAGGVSSGGTLYLTNIHRIYDPSKKRGTREAELQSWAGPEVNRKKALDTGEILRERITSHKRVMIINDEAHHVWDPDSAWNEAIEFLNDETRKRNDVGLVAQLDFSATPKDNNANLFKHIVVDTPLGEAVDGGIVKTPIIGRGHRLVEQTSDNAGVRYQNHLLIGYKRWMESKKEWEKSGKKALLFVMCEDTGAADQITRELNSNPLYEELNNRTINLHTNLKGKVISRGSGENKVQYFKESDKEISDDDLKALRELSRQLDDNTSPYLCIVSVLMLREGWDVRNVTTIVPLRPYSSKANILPEQTLGRGLRRMTLPGQANEAVTVIEHPAFSSLYREQLSQEGLCVEEINVEDIKASTVSIFPDTQKKNFKDFDLVIPKLTSANKIVPSLEGISIKDIEESALKYKKLPLGNKLDTEIQYEGRQLITGEIIEQMKIKLPLLQNGFTAVSFYREELENVCQISGTHFILAPLIQKFIEEMLFTEKTSFFDQRLCNRLADADVREYIRAVFVSVIRKRITKTETRLKLQEPVSVCSWKPFQVTHSARHPAETAEKTPFNLVPCNRTLEVAFTHFADRAPDLASFCKNAGPQCLRIDFLSEGSRLAFYTPDFILRKKDGHYFLVETKGREDRDVPSKAKAAISWCKAASTKQIKWSYLYVPEGIFESLSSNTVDELERVCSPTLVSLIEEKDTGQMFLSFDDKSTIDAGITDEYNEFIDEEVFKSFSEKTASLVRQAIQLFRHFEKKKDVVYSPVFTPLQGPIDKFSEKLIFDRLYPDVPKDAQKQRDFFQPYMSKIDPRKFEYLRGNASRIQKLLIYNASIMPISILIFCIEYENPKSESLKGVFESIRKNFHNLKDSNFLRLLKKAYDFRNTYVAHQDKELNNIEVTRGALKEWIALIVLLEETCRAKVD